MSGYCRCARRGWAVAAVLLVACPAWAQRDIRLRTLTETPLPYVTTCVAPAAAVAVVNDTAGVLAVGHRPDAETHISIFKLDDQGQPTADTPALVALPKPAALGDRPNYPIALACHPRFPLLYVWQDVEPPPAENPIDPAASAEFDHLLIYSVEETPPRLLLATARRANFHCGAKVGGFALDVANGRLYAPNMQQPGPMQTPIPAIGWIRISPDGLPLFETGDAPAEADAGAAAEVVAATPLAPADAAAARETRLAALAQSQASGIPAELSKYLESATVTFGDWPSPYSYAPLSDNAVLMTSYSGPVSWVLSDRLGRFGYFFITPYVPYRYRLAAHPTLPAAYVTVVNYDGRLLRMQVADGYFTLVPQTATLDNVVIHSPPLLVTRSSQVLMGSTGRICFVDFNSDGVLQPTGGQMTVNNPQVEALAWSERFGRVYVPVEKTP